MLLVLKRNVSMRPTKMLKLMDKKIFRKNFTAKNVHLNLYTMYSSQKHKINPILANSGDPDEMPQYAAFHQGLHCLL